MPTRMFATTSTSPFKIVPLHRCLAPRLLRWGETPRPAFHRSTEATCTSPCQKGGRPATGLTRPVGGARVAHPTTARRCRQTAARKGPPPCPPGRRALRTRSAALTSATPASWPVGKTSTGTVALGEACSSPCGLFFSTTSRSSQACPLTARAIRARIAYGQRRKE
jgi:hypothetical protein